MKELQRKYIIKSEVENVYAAFTNPFMIELWSGYPAIMSETPESEFSLFEGDITGKNIEFVKNKLIKQQWDFGDEPVNSIVTLDMEASGNKTVIFLKQTEIPDEAFENIAYGWDEYYINAIKQLLED